MKYILLFFTLIIYTSMHAQLLYLHDIDSVKYNACNIGEKIELMLKDIPGTKKGIITSVQTDGLTLNDTLKVKLSDVTALVKDGNGGYTGERVHTIVIGSYLLYLGTFNFMLGTYLLTLPFKEGAGMVFILLGGGLGVGGYRVIKKQVKKARNKTTIQLIDNIHYRLIIK